MLDEENQSQVITDEDPITENTSLSVSENSFVPVSDNHSVAGPISENNSKVQSEPIEFLGTYTITPQKDIKYGFVSFCAFKTVFAKQFQYSIFHSY